MLPGTWVSQNQVLCILNTSSVDSSIVQFFIHRTRVSQTQVWFGYCSSTIQAHTRVHWIRVWLWLQAHHTWVHWTRVVYCHTKVKNLSPLYFFLYYQLLKWIFVLQTKAYPFFGTFNLMVWAKCTEDIVRMCFCLREGEEINIWEKVTFFFFFWES